MNKQVKKKLIWSGINQSIRRFLIFWGQDDVIPLSKLKIGFSCQVF